MYIKCVIVLIYLSVACTGKSSVGYNDIERLIEIREYNKAIDLLKEISPDDTLLGRLYILAGRYDEALECKLSTYQLAWVYQRLGMYGNAICSYDDVDGILYENAMYNCGICASEMGDTAEAIIYFKMVENFSDAKKRLAISYETEEKYTEALSIWREIDGAEALYHKAEIYNLTEKTGDSLYKELSRNYPQSPYALKALEKATVPQKIMVAVLYGNKRYSDALNYISKKDHRMRALCFEGLGKYKDAASEYKSIKDHLNAGRCLEKAGFLDEALKEYLSSESNEGYLRTGVLYENMGKGKKAIDAYSKVGSSLKKKANLRSGLLSLDEEKRDLAKKYFKHTFPVSGNYWLAKITGMSPYRSYVLSESPLSYYAYLLDGEVEISDSTPEEWIASLCDTTYSLSREDSVRLLKGKLLLEYGIIEKAKKELSMIGEDNLLFRYRFALLTHKGGLDALAIYWAKKIIDRGHSPFPNKILTLAYPLSFFQTVLKYEKENPFLFMALIREESYFYPMAVSRSNAIGLTQVIPSTGKGIARELGVRWDSPESLKDPDISIKFGVHYFTYCLKRFNGVPEYALAAYNGGPTRAGKWKKDCPTDEWVERIPRTETRLYVKKVMGSYYVYKQLYGDALE